MKRYNHDQINKYFKNKKKFNFNEIEYAKKFSRKS